MSNGANATASAQQRENKRIDGIMLEDSVQRLEKSPYAKTAYGKRVVKLLRTYQDKRWIAFAPESQLPDTRGSWLPGEILINEDFRGNLGKTMPTLVHEAAHGVWKTDHPRAKGVPEPPDEGGENEYHCVLQELIVYRWLRDDVKLAQPDFELDTRVERLENGTLKSSIVSAHKDELMRSKQEVDKALSAP